MKYKPGMLAQTSAAFAKIVSNTRPLPCVLMRPLGWREGLWLVRLDGFAKPHQVHERMMEGYTMELETTAEAWDALPKAKRVKLDWTQLDKSNWTCLIDGETLPARIRELDKKTYSCYRDGKYLGSEPTLDSAKQRIVVNQLSQKNRVMRAWEQEHPNELPPALQLTEGEREEYWRHHAATKPATTRVTGGAGKAQVASSRPVQAGAVTGRTPSKEPAPPHSNDTGELPVSRKAKGGNKTAIIAALLTKEGGCTSAEVLEATGWTAVSMPQQAKAAGLVLKVDKSCKPFKYYGKEK